MKFYQKFEYEILMAAIICGAVVVLWLSMQAIKWVVLMGDIWTHINNG